MKFERRYCKVCKRITEHSVIRDEQGFERAMVTILTVGFSELMNRYHYMCTGCERTTVYFPDEK